MNSLITRTGITGLAIALIAAFGAITLGTSSAHAATTQQVSASSEGTHTGVYNWGYWGHHRWGGYGYPYWGYYYPRFYWPYYYYPYYPYYYPYWGYDWY